MAGPWNWKPDEPVGHNPLFYFPPRWRATAGWYIEGWKPNSEYGVFLLLALLSFYLFQPPLTQISSDELNWVLPIYFRNLAYILLIAGGLHWYFHVRKFQGEELRYDTRDQSKGSRYLFGRQLYDNMFWSLASGVTLWTAYECLLYLLMAQGRVAVWNWSDGWLWFVALFFLIPIWISAHFYAVHRLLHWAPLYRWVHSLHHRNQNTISWTGISMHPVEHLVYFSSVLIHLAIPSHPLHIMFHMYSLTISAVFGHTGFDALLIRGKRFLAIGHFHHQLHHRYFEVNYGASELPCDEWFGSFDDGTPEGRKRMRHRTQHN